MKTLLFIVTGLVGALTICFGFISLLLWIGLPAALIIAVGNLAGLFAVSWVWFFVSLIPIVALVLTKIFAIFSTILASICAALK